MTEMWLISVPMDKTSSSSVEQLKRSIAKTNQTSCSRFSIPDLKVGILDSLLSMSEDLCRLDTLTESVIKKSHQCLKEMMENFPEKETKNTQDNGDHRDHQKVPRSPLNADLKSLKVDLMSYVTKFQWDKAKYPTSLPLSSLADTINKDVSLVETELNCRNAAFHSVKGALQNLESQLNGNLHTCNLSDVVSKDDLLVSEYLTTLLVVVSRGNYQQWESTYESLSEFVVPRSSRKLYEDGEAGVFSVALFKRAVREFKAKAQERRFTVREYCFDVEEEKERERKQLRVQKKEQYRIFVRWLKVNFTEVFIAWIHLKGLRVFVESVLRYGLPVNYQALLLQTQKKHSKKLRGELASLFDHLDPTDTVGKMDQSYDIPGLCQQEYFSYVFFDVNTKLLEIT